MEKYQNQPSHPRRTLILAFRLRLTFWKIQTTIIIQAPVQTSKSMRVTVFCRGLQENCQNLSREIECQQPLISFLMTSWWTLTKEIYLVTTSTSVRLLLPRCRLGDQWPRLRPCSGDIQWPPCDVCQEFGMLWNKELLFVLLSKFYSFVPLCDTGEAIEVNVLCSSLAH